MQAALAPVAAAAAAKVVVPAPAPREQARRERDDDVPVSDACPTCAPRAAHDFGRVSVHERAPYVPQASLVVGAAGDHYEREADAAADRVMRMTEADAPPCTSCGATDEKVQRLESPYSPDDGVVTPVAGGQEDDAASATPVQAKPAPGAAASGAMVIAPSAGRAIRALRGGGTPLPAPLRGFMESRYGHDFGRVRVHTGSAAAVAARAIHARAYTLGHDIVFGAGQYAADSASGRHLIAHELAHVIQQGQAPRAVEPDVVRRVQWSPNTPTGKASAPWGPGNPTGKLLNAKTDGGTALQIWQPDDGTTYWCHGYTFGGSVAKGGPYSIFGEDVPKVLKDDGWKQTYSCMAQPGDILVFSNSQGMVQHTGVIRQVVSTGAKVDDSKSMLQSKWGSAPLNTDTWAVNAKQYGRYCCWSKTPQTGVCSGTGASEALQP
jgi:hypothetical protein